MTVRPSVALRNPLTKHEYYVVDSPNVSVVTVMRDDLVDRVDTAEAGRY